MRLCALLIHNRNLPPVRPSMSKSFEPHSRDARQSRDPKPGVFEPGADACSPDALPNNSSSSGLWWLHHILSNSFFPETANLKRCQKCSLSICLHRACRRASCFSWAETSAPVHPSPLQSFQHSSRAGKSFFFFFGEQQMGRNKPKRKGNAWSWRKGWAWGRWAADASPWDERVKISAAQLSERGQGSGSTSGTQWELPVDASWH